MKVKDVLDRVTTLYNDTEYIRIPESHYLKFLDDALSMIVMMRPDSHVKTEIVKLVPGTRQTLPKDGISLIEIYMNKKAIMDGSGENIIGYSSSYPVAHVEREDLDYFSNWQSGVGVASKDHIDEFAYELKSPRTFWVNPYVSDIDPVYVEMDYSYAFEKYGDATQNIDGSYEETENKEIDISDTFMAPICYYMLYLLYSTDSTSQLDKNFAASYLQQFQQALNIEYQSNQNVMPRTDKASVEAAIRQQGGSTN